MFAGLIFAVSVVSLPMILDRQTDSISAGLLIVGPLLGHATWHAYRAAVAGTTGAAA